MKNPKKVLITGVRGFVGSNLKVYLKNQDAYHLTGASRDRENLKTELAYLDDICSYDELYEGNTRYDAYIHLAGKVIHNNYDGEEEEYFKVNYEQTKRVYDRFLKDKNAETFIFLSTIHVLTEKPGEVIQETYKPQPFTPYGKSKYEAENYIFDHAKKGKNYYILRPSMIHGPGNKGNLNLLYELVIRGFPYPLGKINNRRSFVSIDNLSFIIHELLLNNVKSGLYHIADDEPTYTHELIKLIADITGKSPKMLSIPPKIIWWIAKLGNYFPIPLNEHRLLKLTEDFIVSNKKIKNAIGKPLPVTSRDGLEKTIRSFQNLSK